MALTITGSVCDKQGPTGASGPRGTLSRPRAACLPIGPREQSGFREVDRRKAEASGSRGTIEPAEVSRVPDPEGALVNRPLGWEAAAAVVFCAQVLKPAQTPLHHGGIRCPSRRRGTDSRRQDAQNHGTVALLGRPVGCPGWTGAAVGERRQVLALGECLAGSVSLLPLVPHRPLVAQKPPVQSSTEPEGHPSWRPPASLCSSRNSTGVRTLTGGHRCALEEGSPPQDPQWPPLERTTCPAAHLRRSPGSPAGSLLLPTSRFPMSWVPTADLK